MNKEEKLKLFKGIRRSNKKFDSSSKAEKRVMIAKDILKLLKAEVVSGKAGEYVEFNSMPFFYDDQAQGHLHNIPKCEVCGIGGIAYAYILRKNNCTIGEMDTLGSGDILKMVKIFPKRQMNLIESAFEQWDSFDNGRNKKVPAFERAYYFRSNNNCPKHKRGTNNKALELIMKNIIKNKGTFKP